MIRINKLGNPGNGGTPVTVFPSNWAPNPLPDGTSQVSNNGTTQDDWEEFVSFSIDPDGQTFWGTGEWLPSTQTGCSASNECTWDTQVFLCQAGSGFCQ